MDDDDAPPSLDGLTAQVSAISSSKSDIEAVADITFCGGGTQSKRDSKTSTMRRGFFNKTASKKPIQRPKKSRGEDMPTIKAKHGSSTGPSIPEFLMVEPSEYEKRLQAEKMKLLDTLKPTEETVNEAMQSPDLASGFDDPEVMRAVQDIGSNPKLMQTKYKNNKKVQRFYAAMAGHVGQRLNSLGVAGKGK